MNLADAILIHKGDEHHPCLVLASLDKDHECQQDDLSLSYHEAALALEEHRQFLNHIVSSRRGALAGKNRDAATAAVSQAKVVLAYLGQNSVDLFLSVLAASSLTDVLKDQTESSTTVAALLNTRWTVNEIVQALKLRNDDDNDLIHCTVLLYDSDADAELGDISRLAAQKLSSSSSSTGGAHFIQCVPLSNFARARMTSTTLPSGRSSYLETQHKNPAEFPPYQSIRSDDAVIVFTSGTTGGSKGVRLGHRAVYVQCLAKLQEPCGYSKTTRLLANTVPFFHVGGLSSLLAVWLAGGMLVFPSAGAPTKKPSAFDSRTTLTALRHGFANTLVVVPAMLYALQQEQQQQKHSALLYGTDVVFPAVRLILIGGQSAEASTLHFVRQTFPKARLVQTYACTEAASSLTFHDVTCMESVDSDLTMLSGDCVGIPPPHVELRLVRPAFDTMTSSSTVPADEHDFITDPFVPGIIATRGPHVMNGYWSRTASSSSVSATPNTTGEWLRTNDLGFWKSDLETLYFHGRVTDSIRTGGETVLAAEVERCLLRHPSIAECAVFALPDRQWGETVACAIVLVDDDKLRMCDDSSLEQRLRSWCQQEGLAGYKRPRLVFRLDVLPRNSSGKVLKFKLVELFVSRQHSHL